LIVALLLFRNARPRAVRYRTAPVERRTIESLVDAAGRLDVTTRIEVPAPAAGQLFEILVREGASVTQGQVLAQLDEAAAGIAVGGARATVHGADQKIQEAQAALEAATDARVRLERLLPRGLVSESDVVNARTSETKARAAVAAARAERSASSSELSAAELAKKVRTLRAPMDGVVMAAPRWPGAVVSPERGPLFVIGSPLAELRIEVQVAEASVGQVLPAQNASFTVPAFPERAFAAEVDRVMLEAQREGGAVSYPVVLRAKNPGELMPGMSANVRIRVARAENVLAVRDAALRFTPDQAPQAPPRSRLWLTPDGARVESVSVASGVSDGVYTEVWPVGGATLQPGAQVVIGRLTTENGDNRGPGISLGSKR
jgi:HlyD family secretion protein